MKDFPYDTHFHPHNNNKKNLLFKIICGRVSNILVLQRHTTIEYYYVSWKSHVQCSTYINVWCSFNKLEGKNKNKNGARLHTDYSRDFLTRIRIVLNVTINSTQIYLIAKWHKYNLRDFKGRTKILYTHERLEPSMK